jgi:dTDP-4-amino-4,6-dideoxy-D-galactose acyltransferase
MKMLTYEKLRMTEQDAIEVFVRENIRKIASQFYYNPFISEKAIITHKLKEVMEKVQSGAGFCSRNKSTLKALGIINHSKWDSAILGENVGKLTLYLSSLNETELFLQKIYLEAKKMKVDVLFTRINMEQSDQLQAILAEGAILSDVLITFYKNFYKEELLQKASLLDKSDIIFEKGKTAFEAELRKITASAYKHSHYFNDPKIPLKKAEAIYQEWISNSIQGYADNVIIAKLKEKIVGYVTFRIESLDEKAFGVIDLIAVEKNYRGRGIGRMLVNEGIKKFCRRIDSLYVSTQISNIPALRLYEGLGFKAISSEATFHIWLRT